MRPDLQVVRDDSPELKLRGFYGLTPMQCHPNAMAVQLHAQKRATAQKQLLYRMAQRTIWYAHAFTRGNDFLRHQRSTIQLFVDKRTTYLF